MIIYVDTPINDELKKELRAKATGYECIFKSDLKEDAAIVEAISKASVIFGNPRPASLLEKAAKLQWIQLYSTGFEYYRHLQLRAVMTNMQDYYSEPCAQTAIAGILALYRGTDQYTLLKAEKKWIGYPMRAGLQTLSKKNILILGAGNIAKRIAAILSVFDCTITFFARSAGKDTINTTQELENTIPTMHLIIACLPGTEETRGLFTNSMVQSINAGAIFCNVGRGNLVEDENILAQALKTKKIAGAVLDVTDQEPLSADSPLWDCPNTILSQHSGGGNNTEYEGLLAFFLQNLERYTAGTPLLNQVMLQKGY